MSRLVRTASTIAGIGICVPAWYLGLLTVVGWRRPSPPTVVPSPRTRFAVLVPAHNEEAGIGDTLTSLCSLDYPNDLVSIHVVADNCTDSTASVARAHPCTVHVRTVPTEPGKGPALNWLLGQLRAGSFDAVAIVDADTIVVPDFLRAMDVVVCAGAVAAQGRYMVREPDASPATTFRYAALACRHHLRPLGRRRLGASCGLYGNGMVFARSIAEERPWSGHLVEDAEFQMELLLDGHHVTYVPDAVVLAEMPTTLDRAESQNRRWERGRIELAVRYVPLLLRRFVTGRDRLAVGDAILDHLTPPISALVVADVATVLVGVGGALFGSRSLARLTPLGLFGLSVVGAHAAVGLWSIDAPRSSYRALLSAPRQVLWKFGVWWSVLRPKEPVSWIRTARNAPMVSS